MGGAEDETFSLCDFVVLVEELDFLDLVRPPDFPLSVSDCCIALEIFEHLRELKSERLRVESRIEGVEEIVKHSGLDEDELGGLASEHHDQVSLACRGHPWSTASCRGSSVVDGVLQGFGYGFLSIVFITFLFSHFRDIRFFDLFRAFFASAETLCPAYISSSVIT